MEKQRKTFLSYSRVNKDFAIRLAKELKLEGFDIWLDQLDIPAGSRWDREVEKALRECEIFMIILTSASVDSENVLDEIGYAIDNGKRFLPVLLEKCDVPFRLRRFQYVDFTDKDFDDGVESAKELLRSLVAQPTIPRMTLSEEQQSQIAAQKAEEERLAKADADRKAKEEADGLADQKAEEERLAKAEAEGKAKEKAERLAALKADEERVAKKKAEEERFAKTEADRKAEDERLAEAKAETDRKAKEEAERLAALKAEEERVAKQKAEEERLAKVKADRKAKVEAERLAAQKAEEERLAKQKAENDRAVRANGEAQVIPEAGKPVDAKAKPVVFSPSQKKPVSRGLIFGVAAVVMVVCTAIGFRALTSLTSVTEEPTSTAAGPTKTSTAEPINTAILKPSSTPNSKTTQPASNSIDINASPEELLSQAQQWDLKLSDTFDDNNNDWDTFGSNDKEWGIQHSEVTKGKYRWSNSALQGQVNYSEVPYTASALTDFFVTFEAEEIQHLAGSEYGITWYDNGVNQYYFGIRPEQKEYSLYLLQNNEWRNIVDSTTSLIIRSGEPNKLTLIVLGSRFLLYINDKFMIEATDDTVKRGKMFLSITVDANDAAVVEFDNFELRALPK